MLKCNNDSKNEELPQNDCDDEHEHDHSILLKRVLRLERRADTSEAVCEEQAGDDSDADRCDRVVKNNLDVRVIWLSFRNLNSHNVAEGSSGADDKYVCHDACPLDDVDTFLADRGFSFLSGFPLVQLVRHGDRDSPLLDAVEPTNKRVVEVHQNVAHRPAPRREIFVCFHPSTILAQVPEDTKEAQSDS